MCFTPHPCENRRIWVVCVPGVCDVNDSCQAAVMLLVRGGGSWLEMEMNNNGDIHVTSVLENGVVWPKPKLPGGSF